VSKLRHIYTCVDIGSDTIKVVVCELYHGRYNLLATSCVPSKGIRKGLITDVNEAKHALRQAFSKAEAMLGFKITKTIAIIPSYYSDFNMIKGSLNILNEDLTIKGKDVIDVLQESMKGQHQETKEMLTIIPIDFTLDSGVTKEPLGKKSSTLSARSIMVSTPKKNIYSVVTLLSSIGIEVVDISLGCIGDIYALKNQEVESCVSAVVNIGTEKTEVSLYNKGIIVKHAIVNMGSKNVDNDIAYMYKIDTQEAKKLKETFAFAHKNSASLNETREAKNKLGEVVKINQYEISEIVSSRLEELLILVNQELNAMTSHQPEYIFLTGGITNMTNFEQISREKLGKCAIIGNVNLIGIRNNKFSSALGNIIYFVNKLRLKGKNYSMISSEEMENLATPKKNINQDSVLGKFVEYFFGE